MQLILLLILCKGFLLSSGLKKHVQSCDYRDKNQTIDVRSLKAKSRLNILEETKKSEPPEVQYFLSKLKKDDEVADVVKGDDLIMRVVRKLLDRKLEKREAADATKQRARLLARLLIFMRLVHSSLLYQTITKNELRYFQVNSEILETRISSSSKFVPQKNSLSIFKFEPEKV